MADPVLDPLKDFQSTSINKVPYLDYLAIIIPAVTPKDRAAPEELKGVTPVLPSPKNLKDILGGVPGLLKGIVVDNVLPIYGAQPLSSGDQPKRTVEQLMEGVPPEPKPSPDGKYHISKIDDWPAEVRHNFLRRLEAEQRLRVAVASTVEGRELLRQREIRLSDADRQIADALQVKRENAAKKKGGGNPVVTAVNLKINEVVNAVTQLDQLFAANPPDP